MDKYDWIVIGGTIAGLVVGFFVGFFVRCYQETKFWGDL